MTPTARPGRAFLAAALAILVGGCASGGTAAPPETTGAAAEPVPAPEAEPAPSPATDADEIRFVPPEKDYPLETCVVSGESLALMGEPVAIEYRGVVIHLCCNHCIAEFKRDPAKYLSVVKAVKSAR